MTGSTSHTIATNRLVMNALPNAAITSNGPSPPSIPVTRPATVTTRSGLSRRTKPTTTTAMPINVNLRRWSFDPGPDYHRAAIGVSRVELDWRLRPAGVVLDSLDGAWLE